MMDDGVNDGKRPFPRVLHETIPLSTGTAVCPHTMDDFISEPV